MLSRQQQVARHVERALVFLDLLRLSDAQAALDEALRLDNDDIPALTLRGRLALTQGKPDTARPDAERALRLAPGDPDLLATVAALSPLDQARRDLNAVLLVKPDDIDALFARARAHLGSSRLEAALTDLNRNLSVAPEDARARALRARVLLRQHYYDLAALDADHLLARHSRDIQALEIKAAARLGLGDDAGAVATLTELLDGADGVGLVAMPIYQDARITRGRLYAKQRRFAEAKRDLDVLVGQKDVRAILKLQIFLQSHGYPSVEISGGHTAAFDAALEACFSDTTCGPNLFR